MEFSIIEILNLITIFLLSFFSFFLFSYKKGNKLNNYFLGWLLLTNAVFNLTSLVYTNIDDLSQTIFIVLSTSSSVGFFFGPSIYFYTKSLTDKCLRINKTFLIHIIPFFLSILYFNTVNYKNWRIEYFSIVYIHIFIYIIFSTRILYNFQIKIKDLFSSVDKLHLKRLWVVLIVFSSLWILDIVLFISRLQIIFPEFVRVIFVYFLFVINLFLALFVVYDSLTHPELLNVKMDGYEAKYKKSKLTSVEKNKYIQKLDYIISTQKPYFNSYLTLSELSKLTEIPSRALSQIINESKKMNFYDFINTYRVNEAKILLSSSTDKTILEILFEVGFNSKSAFNNAFKKFTGTTPISYKKQIFKK